MVVIRGTSPPNVILVSLAIGTAALVALAVLRTLRPLISSADAAEPELVGNRTRAAYEREKNLVLRSIKELEFDRAMGKLAEADYNEMVQRLRARAVRIMKQLDAGGSGYRELIERELASRLVKTGSAKAEPYREAAEPYRESNAVSEEPPADAPGFCGSCGKPRDADARFCKHCGTRLIGLLLAISVFASPAWAQIQMPDPKQMAGIPRPVTDLPERAISVRLVRGQLTNNITNHPVELHAGGRVLTSKTDENGRAEFNGLTPGTMVRAVAVVDGERLESEEFPSPAQGGIRLILVASEKPGAGSPSPASEPQPGTVVLGSETRVILDLSSDDALTIYYLLDVSNTARAPVIPSSPVTLDMPSGAQGTAILDATSTQAQQVVTNGNRVTLIGPFQSGHTPVGVVYQLPYTGARLSLTQKFPVALANVSVLMKKVGSMSLSSPQFSTQQERAIEGEPYVLAQGAGLPSGGALTLDVAGLPHHSPVPRTIALSLACLMVGVGTVASSRKTPRGDAGRVKQLKTRREKLFTDLIRLEEQRRAGSADPSRYAERRLTLISQLERIYRELDAEGGEGLAA